MPNWEEHLAMANNLLAGKGGSSEEIIAAARETYALEEKYPEFIGHYRRAYNADAHTKDFHDVSRNAAAMMAAGIEVKGNKVPKEIKTVIDKKRREFPSSMTQLPPLQAAVTNGTASSKAKRSVGRKKKQ